jgi:hypothetical protein
LNTHKTTHNPKIQKPPAVSGKTTKLRMSYIRENVGVLVKSSGLLIWFIIFLLALLEIKRYYNIDVIPGYDSSVDDAYGFMRGTLSEFFRGTK